LQVTESLESYAKAFETMKKIRTLVWKSHLGFANIDLEIGDKKLNLTVSPVHAAIIYQFQEKAEWLASDLVSQSSFAYFTSVK
jgi:anaphase-promoting complex subunit 2